MSVVRRVANPTPAALAIINPKGGRKMAARKRTRSKSRKAPRRAAVRSTPRRAPLRRTRRRRANPTRARGRRRITRRRSNPLGGAARIAIGAVAAQVLAGFIPIGGSGPLIQAAKTFGAGWLLQRFVGRMVPSIFGEAQTGGGVAAGVILINAFVMPTVSGFLRPSNGNGNGNGVQGFSVVPRGGVPMFAGGGPVQSQAIPSRTNVNGFRSVAR
jgi:hypothetical protein